MMATICVGVALAALLGWAVRSCVRRAKAGGCGCGCGGSCGGCAQAGKKA